MITIITITKKPKLINYNNAPLTKTQLLKNIIKIGHNIWKKTKKNKTKSKELNTRGRGKRPEASMLKEYMTFPWSIIFFFFIHTILIYLFPHHLGANVALVVVFPLHLVLLLLEGGGGGGGGSYLELIEDFFKELSWTGTLGVQQ